MKKILLSMLAFPLVLSANAQNPGDFDPGFGTIMGTFITDAFGNDEDENGMDGIVLPDGKVVLIGSAVSGSANDVILVRLKQDGTRDSAWGNDGVISFDFSIGGDDIGQSIQLQNDGKIVISGMTQGATSDIFVARMDTGGVLDNNFGNFGVAVIDGGGEELSFGLDISPDGTIVVAGYTLGNLSQDAFFAKLTSAGILDNNFSTDGIETIDGTPVAGYLIRSMQVDNSNRIVFCGTNGMQEGVVGRLAQGGGLDNSFATSGLFNYKHAGVLTIFFDFDMDAAGMIYPAGGFAAPGGSTSLLMKLNGGGDTVTTFGTNGAIEYYETQSGNELVYTAVTVTDEGVIACGSVDYNYFALMYDPLTGDSIDEFGVNGVAINATNPFSASSLQSCIQLDDNRILMIGTTDGGLSDDITAMAVFIRVPEYVGVPDMDAPAFTLYPNPSAQYFNIINPSSEKISRVELLNASGQMVCVYNENPGTYQLPQQLAGGMYFVRIYTEHAVAVTQLSVFE